MRYDIYIGVVLAALVHLITAYSDRIFPESRNGIAIATEEDVVPTIALKLPELEPEPPEDIPEPDAGETAPDIADIAPPMQADVPTAVITPTAFLQRLQPPPPQKLGSLVATITIPAGNFSAAGNRNLGAMFDLASLDQKPTPRFRVNPVYPYEMRLRRESGQVLVGFIVDASGDVVSPHIISSTNATFEAEALRAIAKWKFNPGRKNGANVSTRNVQQPFNFSLN